MSLHVAILDPAVSHPELDTFNQLVRRQSPDFYFTYHLPALHGMQSLYYIEDNIEAVILLGSGASVHDILTWQEELKSWLQKTVVQNSIPFLGICYGHQLIASMFGASVEFAFKDRRKLQEIRSLECKRSRFTYSNCFEIVMSHREAVVSTPAQFDIFLRSKEFRVEGLQHKTKPIWTISGHPEATTGFIQNQNMALDKDDQKQFESGHRFLCDFLNHVKTITDA